MKRQLCLVACCVVAGCGDPLSGVGRLDDVVLAEPTSEAPTTASVAASEEEINRRPGLFGLLRRGADAPVEPTVVEDAPVSETGELQAPIVRGNGGADDFALEAAVQSASDQAPVVAQEDVAQEDVAQADDVAAPVPAAPAVETPKKRGLFARLTSSAAKAKAEKAAVATAVPGANYAPEPKEEPVKLAALQPEDTKPARKKKRLGLRAARTPKIDPNAPDAQLVTYGTAIPYGDVARVCDAPKGGFGKQIATYPERKPQYRMFDSKPSQTGPRTHYITGFDDGCARQFTAALALFGAPALHEQLRYGLPSKVQPYSKTDAAYETVKAKVCRAAKAKPCGAKMDKLAKDTVFVSTYERFVGSPSWANMLLHDGRVIEKQRHSR